MISGIIGRKIGTTRAFAQDGTVVAVTAIEAAPCTVTQVKTEAREGYNAVQLGCGEVKRLSRPLAGHLGKLGKFRHLREFRVDDPGSIEPGQKVDVGLFQPGERVDVTGVSKGKGFAGGVKRYHFGGGPKTHGQSDRHRAPGSAGAGTDPGRTWKGQRMAGHMGNERVTVKNLAVVEADPERNLLLLKGAVPGARKGLLLIKKVKSRGGAPAEEA